MGILEEGTGQGGGLKQCVDTRRARIWAGWGYEQSGKYQMSGFMGGVGIRAERGISNEWVYGQGRDRSRAADIK